jgi:hypothetical protein
MQQSKSWDEVHSDVPIKSYRQALMMLNMTAWSRGVVI